MRGKAFFKVFAAILVLAAGYSGTARGHHTDVFFAEPYSGGKVAQYEVSLPVARDESRAFTIPEQCPEAMTALSAGASQWCSRLEQRLWQKVSGDCHYHAFLHRFPRGQQDDAVSDFDFRNAPLADLLVSFRCAAARGESGEEGCAFVSPPAADIAPLLSFVDPAGDLSGFDADSCRLAGGSFRGHVAAGAQGLVCRSDVRAPGIRLISVDFSDVNGDGWLDAVLRVVPVGPGANRRPLLLTYTRVGAEAPLSVPVEAPGEGDGDAPPAR